MSVLQPVLFLIAFLCALLPIAVFEAQFFMAAFCILAVGVAFMALKYDVPGTWTKTQCLIVFPVLLFWVLALISSFLSDARVTSFIYFCFFSVMPLSFFWTMLVRDKRKFFSWVGGGLGAGFAVLSVWCIAQFFAIPDFMMDGRVRWPFADPNSLAALLSLSFFGALGLMLAGQTRVQSNAGLGLALLLITAIFTTGSRGALIVFIIGLVVFLMMTGFETLKKHKRCFSALFVGFVLAWVLTSFSAPKFARGPGEIAASTINGMPALWDKPAIWNSTWAMIKDHLWSGTGIGTFYLYYPQYRGGDLHTAGFMAHSDPLQFWAEVGIFAPIVFYFFIGTAIFLTVQAFRMMKADDVRRIYIAVPFCALGGLIIHAHITFHFHVLSLLMGAGFLLGYWFWIMQSVVPSGKMTEALERNCLKTFVVFPLLALVCGFVMLQGSEIVLTRAQDKIQAQDIDGYTRDVNYADKMALHQNARAILMAAQIPLGILQHKDLAEGQGVKLTAQGYELLARAEAINPRLPEIYFMKAQFARESAEIKDFLKQALAIDPLHFPSRLMLAQVYHSEGDDVSAYAILKEGMMWREAYDVPSDYYQMTATMALEQGDVETQMTAIRELAKIYNRKR